MEKDEVDWQKMETLSGDDNEDDNEYEYDDDTYNSGSDVIA